MGEILKFRQKNEETLSVDDRRFLSQEFDDVYMSTDFMIHNFIVNIGKMNDSFNHYLIYRKATNWTMITWYNPRQMAPLSEAENRIRHYNLMKELDTYEIYEGEGVGQHGWDSESFWFVLNIARMDAQELAVRGGQIAYVYGKTGGLPGLIYPDYRI